MHTTEASPVLMGLYCGNRAQLTMCWSCVITDVINNKRGYRGHYVGIPGAGKETGKRGSFRVTQLGPRELTCSRWLCHRLERAHSGICLSWEGGVVRRGNPGPPGDRGSICPFLQSSQPVDVLRDCQRGQTFSFFFFLLPFF